jgi:uncharacterized protein
MDFVAARLERFPDLHIYHYALRPTALKSLMSKHGVREVELDDLLRAERLSSISTARCARRCGSRSRAIR